MSERIQKVLDGELPPDTLTRTELAELERLEGAVDAVLAPIRAEPAPDVTDSVMARIRPESKRSAGWWQAAWSTAASWVWTPRPMAVRPVWVIATAAVVALLWWDRPVPAPVPAEPAAPPTASVTPTGEGTVLVHFRLDVPDAESVHLAGDFTDWEPAHALNEAAPGIWTVAVPVEQGVHEYSFVVDGTRWVADPMAPRLDDGFGGSNSRLDVVKPVDGTAL